MEKLPEEVIADIFVRLPPKSLASLRCVSSYWNSLLSDDPSFIRMHLHRSSQPRNRRLLLIYTDHLISKLAVLPPTLDEFSGLTPPSPPNLGNSSSIVKLEVIGVCNGVICLSMFRDPYQADVLLWNPSINQSFTLPCSHQPISGSVSLGYNPFSGRLNDFKVVKTKHAGAIRSHVEVYSLVTNSWKEVGDSFPSWCQWFGKDHGQVILNEFICWCPPLGFDFDAISSSLRLFDVVNEEFRDIELPQSLSSYQKKIAVLDDCLCVIAFLRRNMEKVKVFQVWKMEEFGVVGSWTKVYAFQLSTILFPLYKPLGLGADESSYGCFLVFAHNNSVNFEPKPISHLALYNTEDDTFSRVFNLSFDSVSTSHLYTYAETLISPLPG